MFIMLDYHCARCGSTFESLEARDDVPATKRCECGAAARRCLSAVKTRTTWGEAATRGRPEEPPSPDAIDTRPIAEGTMTVKEWRQKRQAQAREARVKQLRSMVA